jgi:hypothetical protein
MDLMVDLETFGTGPKAVIASIGAVVFDYKAASSTSDYESPEIKDSRCFYRSIDARSQPNREFSAETIYWWMKQPIAAQNTILPKLGPDNRKFIYEEMVPLAKALNELTKFVKTHNIEKMWCYGATFDHVILMDAYKEMGQSFPVSYRDLLDMRTFVYIMPKVERPDFGVSHNALDDCINQAIWMQKIWAEFNSSELPTGFVQAL